MVDALNHLGYRVQGFSGLPPGDIDRVRIAGSLIPDQTQRMRINVRAALIDVASGRWSMITAKSSENTALSPAVLRQSSDQKQVEKLKAEGYASLAEDLGRS